MYSVSLNSLQHHQQERILMHSGGDLEAVRTRRRRGFVTAVVLLAAVAFPCSLLYLVSTLETPLPILTSLPAGVLEEVKLRRVLKAAAMADEKTVIITTVNSAWTSPGSVLDLFMESFKLGNGTSELLDHLVVVAMDHKGYVRCMEVHKHCFALATEGVDFSEQKNFMSDGYLKMMWSRVDFLGLVLDLGFDFIFTDTDIMWFRNPLPHFYPDGDFQIACDYFVGNPEDLKNTANGGFNYVKSNNRTIKFYKYWYSSKDEYPGHHDQDVFNFIKTDSFIRRLGLRMRFLDTAYFGGLCEPSKNFSKVCTMHANCCIGLGRKVRDLGVMLEDWRKFMSMTLMERQTRRMSWSVPKNCSLAPLG